MRHTILFFLAIASVALAGQTKKTNEIVRKTPASDTTVVIAVKTAQCDMCASVIADAAKGVNGVREVTVDLDAHVARVVFDRSTTGIGTIESAIADAGYDANATKRSPEAYKSLPACCR